MSVPNGQQVQLMTLTICFIYKNNKCYVWNEDALPERTYQLSVEISVTAAGFC